jgi:hypothetical protein
MFMEEANEFIAELAPKLLKKYFIILTLRSKRMTQSYSKNYKMKFGSFAQNLLVCK